MPPIETNLTDLFHHVTINSSNNEFDSHIGNVHICLSSCCKYCNFLTLLNILHFKSTHSLKQKNSNLIL